jgi:oligoribonuclease (3'-5' exoribonuclease)
MKTPGEERLPDALLHQVEELQRSHEDIPGLMDRLEVGQLTLAEARLMCRELQRRYVEPDSTGISGGH